MRGKEGCLQVSFQIEKGNIHHLRDGKRDSGKKRDSVVHVMFKLVFILPRKEVIQPQVLLRLPCYDFTPLAEVTFGAL